MGTNSVYYARGQGADPIVSGTNFNIYANQTGGLAFQHGMVNETFTIEVLSGVWNGTGCTLGMTTRGGKLSFYSNNLTYVQLSHNNEFGMRLTYEGISLTEIDEDKSWNGTIPVSRDCYLAWSFGITMPHETYFMLGVGILGIILMFGGIMISAQALRKYKLEVLNKEILVYSVPMLIIGFGFAVIWLWGA